MLINNDIRNIVEVGCGDFWIMRRVLGKLSEAKYNFFYTGIDVVADLINYNTERFSKPNIRFIFKDAADDEPLPNGDILIVRQAIQHMNNADVKKVLDKTGNFKFLFITEHIYDAPDAVHNVDKPTNNYTRLGYKSGIFLEHAPFNYKNIVHLLKVPVPKKSGIIRSSLIIN